MAFFRTTDSRGRCFTVNPKVTHHMAGWVITAYCDDAGMYGGHYTAHVGWADSIDFGLGVIPFKLKRDATEAMASAISAGILRLEGRT